MLNLVKYHKANIVIIALGTSEVLTFVSLNQTFSLSKPDCYSDLVRIFPLFYSFMDTYMFKYTFRITLI
jgi:hypothetical protein